MVGADGLLGGGDEVLVLARAADLVELFVEVAKLRHLAHYALVHHEGRLQRRGAEVEVQGAEGAAGGADLRCSGGPGQRVPCGAADLQASEAPLAQEVDGVADQRLVEQHAVPCEEVAARARHLRTLDRIGNARELRQVIVREHPVFALELAPRRLDPVVVLVVVHRHIVRHKVA